MDVECYPCRILWHASLYEDVVAKVAFSAPLDTEKIRPEARGITLNFKSRGVGAVEKVTVLLLSSRLIVLYAQMSLFLESENNMRQVAFVVIILWRMKIESIG